jgi:hypothetical protein
LFAVKHQESDIQCWKSLLEDGGRRTSHFAACRRIEGGGLIKGDLANQTLFWELYYFKTPTSPEDESNKSKSPRAPYDLLWELCRGAICYNGNSIVKVKSTQYRIRNTSCISRIRIIIDLDFDWSERSQWLGLFSELDELMTVHK